MKLLTLISLIMTLQNPSFAAVPAGSFCVSPESLSVARGTKAWLYLDRGTENEK